MTKRISTAAYLAGLTTIAVSLPMMASAHAKSNELIDDTKMRNSASDYVQTDNRPDENS